MKRRLTDNARALHRRRSYLRRKALATLQAVADRAAKDEAYGALVRHRLLLLARVAGI
jgi:predicted transcriptional regulator